MYNFLRVTGRFLARMDRATWTSLGVSALLLLFVLTMYFFGQQWLHLEAGDSNAITELMTRAGTAPLALLGVISIFALLALTGFPQILLITACVITFGTVTGAVYAWIATMASAAFTFGLGHVMGAGWVARLSGARSHAMIDFLSRRAVLASAIIRVVPSAPFIVINSAAGAAHLPLWKFGLGTGIGIIPKILLVASLGALAPDGSVLRQGTAGLVDFFTSRSPIDLAFMALIIPLWGGFLWLVRRLYIRLRS